jgi:uncharacterized protein HemX
MAYDEEQASRRSVVVETPTEKREVISSQAVRTPDRSGISAGMVGVLVVVAIALITMLVLFWMSNQQTREENANLAAQQQAQQPPTTVVQQPAQQPPVIIQQPGAPATQPAPIIVTPPAGGSTSTSANNDLAVQSSVDKMLADDPTYKTLGITASVIDGKATLLGIVKTESMKAQVEKSVRKVRGVKDVDNQITVMAE